MNRDRAAIMHRVARIFLTTTVMSSHQPGELACTDEVTWIDLDILAEPIDEQTWKDALAVDDCETTAVDLRPPDKLEEVDAKPPPDPQVLEARLAIRTALRDAHRARHAARRARDQTAATRRMIAKLARESTSTQEEKQLSVTCAMDRRARVWMASCRAHAYRAARRAQATTTLARRACQALGLTAEMFQRAFELSLNNQEEFEQVQTAV